MKEMSIANLQGACYGPDGVFLDHQPISLDVFPNGQRKPSCVQLKTNTMCAIAKKACPVFPNEEPENPYIAFNSGSRSYALHTRSGELVRSHPKTIVELSDGEKAIMLVLIKNQGTHMGKKQIKSQTGYQPESLQIFVSRINKKMSNLIPSTYQGKNVFYNIPPYAGE